MKIDKFKWIKDFYNSRISYQQEIPKIFDHYFMVHFNVGIIDGFPFNEFPANDFTIEGINKKIEINKKFNLFLNHDDESLFRLTSIKELAEIFDLPYEKNLLNEFNNYTGIKILYEQSYKNLKNSVQNLSANNEIHLFIQDLENRWNGDDIKIENLNISPEKYIEYQQKFQLDFCTYLFPSELNWCLITLEDSPVIFACDDPKLINLFDGLELFKLNENEIK